MRAALRSREYELAVLADSPVAYWPLTDAPGATSAVNLAGSGNGTVVGGVTFGQPGVVASDPTQTAALFDGSSGYITPSESLEYLFQQHDFTFETFAYLTSLPTLTRTLFGVGNVSGTTPDTGLGIQVYSANNWQVTQYYDDMNTSVAVLLDQWLHVVYTYVASTKTGTLYINSSNVDSNVFASVLNVGSNVPIQIGANTWTSDSKWDGNIAHVAFYPTALSAARIAAHYNAAKA